MLAQRYFLMPCEDAELSPWTTFISWHNQLAWDIRLCSALPEQIVDKPE